MSPNATVEEGYLLTRLINHLGSASIDHRLRRRDFRCQDTDPAFPWLGMDIAAVENLDQILVVGSNLRQEVPLLAHRVRKAAVRGAGVHFVNPARYPYLFPVGEYLQGTAQDFWRDLRLLVQAAAGESAAPAWPRLRPNVTGSLSRGCAPAGGQPFSSATSACGIRISARSNFWRRNSRA